ncbi:KAP family P-loop NTPase fold protein [Janthinobacterium sp. EB271-G4-7A]|uniref:KAP family P-loop NTPase fold protein n=1 Tax=Janthinobacterium sp. EB271-G4-7A TaxID=2775056 RepID=UPI001E520234|nr:P-loop NTPase fold protein [Janthinobacterium sp. EB271-G4-7A]
MLNRLLVRFSAWLVRFSAWLARRVSAQADQTRTEQSDGGIGAEAPIRTASEDRLRRSDFAGRIASVLSELSLREGRVFAIRGEWGFGKSSLKNLITEQLDAKSERTHWLDFSPWQWGDGDAIVRALFGQMADRLGGDNSKSALARAEALRRYGAILTGAGAPLKEAGSSSDLISMVLTNISMVAVASAVGFDLPQAGTVAFVFAILAVVAFLLGRGLSYFGRDRSGEPLDALREKLEVRLRQLVRPLIVFVDDIDRLEPDQIRLLLRQVKANANLPNIVFVLMFQPSIVERALDPVSDGDGRAFLEKIVQTSFDLPAVSGSIVHGIFGEKLSVLAGEYAIAANGFSQMRWGNALIGCIHPFLRNVRDARRLISSIAVHLPLHVAGDVFEVNIVDFLLLETLRVFEPDLHDALFRERELVLQAQRMPGNGRRDREDQAAAERLLAIASVERREHVRNVLKDLFPPLEWAYGGTNYADGLHGWLNTKRVCTARYFTRYFELQTTAGELSERRFVEFLNATATEAGLASIIGDIEADGLLHSLVARLDESYHRLPVENASVLLPGMFGIAQTLAGRIDLGVFNSPWISAWRATSWYLKQMPEAIRGALVLEAFRQTKAMSVAAILIHLNDPADQTEGHAFDPALDLDTVNQIKSEWLRLIGLRAADGDTLIVEPDLISLLYRWKDYSGSFDEPRDWVLRATQSDEGFARMVTRMMSRGASHSFGDRISTLSNIFDRATVDIFIGIGVAKARCDSIDTEKYPEDKEALRSLQGFLETWLV